MIRRDVECALAWSEPGMISFLLVVVVFVVVVVVVVVVVLNFFRNEHTNQFKM